MCWVVIFLIVVWEVFFVKELARIELGYWVDVVYLLSLRFGLIRRLHGLRRWMNAICSGLKDYELDAPDEVGG